MSDSDNTRPPKFGGRSAFATGRKVRSPDPEVASDKGHPRESWAEETAAWHRAARRRANEALAAGEEPEPIVPHGEVHWDRW